MRLTAIAITATLTASIASAALAGAPASRVADIDYLKASRCAGLASAGTLDQVNAAALSDFVKEQERIRAGYINERAREEAAKAKRQAKYKDGRERLNAELTGPCMAYVGGAATAQSAGSASRPASSQN
jgi:hypothetical protein